MTIKYIADGETRRGKHQYGSGLELRPAVSQDEPTLTDAVSGDGVNFCPISVRVVFAKFNLISASFFFDMCESPK